MESSVLKNCFEWMEFIAYYKLSELQQHQFQLYIQLLISWNELFNITAIVKVEDIINDHFKDSLALVDLYPMNTINTIADVGSGGGFPGIPLAIFYPHIMIILIEVNQKKNSFLQEVIRELGLKNVTISVQDWRTFLRKEIIKIDMFCSRASLSPSELVRVFKPSVLSCNAIVVYFASSHFKVVTKERLFFLKESLYTNGIKERKLVFFKRST